LGESPGGVVTGTREAERGGRRGRNYEDGPSNLKATVADAMRGDFTVGATRKILVLDSALAFGIVITLMET
jgi:hypothetical protein